MYQNPEGDMPLLTLDESVENAISGAIQQTKQNTFLAIEPNIAQRIMKNLAKNLERFSSLNYQPIVLCSPQIRLHFKKLVDRFIPNLVVLSYNELLNDINIQSLGTVAIADAD